MYYLYCIVLPCSTLLLQFTISNKYIILTKKVQTYFWFLLIIITIIENVLRGNNRELKLQVVNYQTINRKYPNQHNDSVLLHLICSEGYHEMFEFLLNPRNHAETDNVPLDIDAKNNKNRTPLLMCFTPPTATFLGQKFGIDEEGTPLNERPDGIESPQDWIKPGGPKSREKCIEYCLKAGADPNIRDFHDFTPLHYAAMWGWTPAW